MKFQAIQQSTLVLLCLFLQQTFGSSFLTPGTTTSSSTIMGSVRKRFQGGTKAQQSSQLRQTATTMFSNSTNDRQQQRQAEEALSASELVTATSTSNQKGEIVVAWSESLFATVWALTMSTFLITNNGASQDCWPSFIESIPYSTWKFIHAISGMVFAGSILTTTVLEWCAINARERAVWKFWFGYVPAVEGALVLPALSGSIVSGVAQAFLSYGNLQTSPGHVKSTLWLLLFFGLWWGVTDRTTQAKAQEVIIAANNEPTTTATAAVAADTNLEIPSVLQFRKFSNIVSCMFLIALYAVMVLKPRFEPPYY